MGSFGELQRAWQCVAENRIRAAEADGKFDQLVGFGRPLEEIIDLEDPNGWIRRTVRDAIDQPIQVFPDQLMGPKSNHK